MERGDASRPSDVSDTAVSADSAAAQADVFNEDLHTDATIPEHTDTDTDRPEDASLEPELPPYTPDVNGDGELKILVMGTHQSILDGAESFSPEHIAEYLSRILNEDPLITESVHVAAESIYRSAVVTTGYGQGRDTYDWPYHCHSLAQYYHWPEGREARLTNLRGDGDHTWDHVIIAGDPHIVSTLPGYHALGVNTVAQYIVDHGADAHLLMPWSRTGTMEDLVRMATSVRRISSGARVPLSSIMTGLLWSALPEPLKDNGPQHPSPNGAYLVASSIYTHLLGRSATASNFQFNDEIAEWAADRLLNGIEVPELDESDEFTTAFHAGGISDRVLTYNHTGTSSERGILRGLRWVLERAHVRLENGGEPPIHFNYGRANTEFEANKRYRISPANFQFSLGFPMQDNSNHGNESMLYGLDKRRSHTENGTDLGVARMMARENELPQARAIPIRTLYARMKDIMPEFSAYADGWHMNHDLDKATGAYMYTLLTGHCAVSDEPEARESPEWRSWRAHKTGYETAWEIMHLSGTAPCFRVVPESVDSTVIRANEDTRLFVSFANAPQQDVIATVTVDQASWVDIETPRMVFTPDNFSTPQLLRIVGRLGDGEVTDVTLTFRTESEDPAFDGIVDRWTYNLQP